MNNSAQNTLSRRPTKRRWLNITAGLFCGLFAALPAANAAVTNADFASLPPLSSSTAANLPNVLVVLDNSQSMDEAPNGIAVGSDNPGSKSEIARGAVKSMIDAFAGEVRMGLMTYQQGTLSKDYLHTSPYNASYDPTNYDPNSSGTLGSSTKKYRLAMPGTSQYIYYNIALPFYASSNQGTAYCYSATAPFPGTAANAGTDTYKCYGTKTGTSDGNSGFSNLLFSSSFVPTDSDIAYGIYQYGHNLAWFPVGPTWFSNTSPGMGYLDVPIAALDSTQTATLKTELGTEQFTGPYTAIRNGGLTPIQGTLLTADQYFTGTGNSVLTSAEGGPVAPPPVNTCGKKDYVVLVTDGLPSVDKDGNPVSGTTALDGAKSAAAQLYNDGIKTYVVGFATDTSKLDAIAQAGGTDHAYSASDSASLDSALNTIFQSVVNRTSAGTAAAVVSNSGDGAGAVYQALYQPSISTNGKTATWVGMLNALFVDTSGYLREDTNGNGKLDGYGTDYVVKINYNATADETQVQRYTSSDGGVTLTKVGSPESLYDLKTIWSAQDQLAALTNVTTNRSYSSSAADGRYIFTWLDKNENGVVDSGEVVPFEASDLTSGNNYRILQATNKPQATNIVDYIRGEEGISGYRNRTVDYKNNGHAVPMRLGDIVHSTPTAVGAPDSQYDTLYGDTTYAAFKQQYANRRQVIYVGANDGMIHAFNGGFWDPQNKSFDTTPPNGASATADPLGSELWAYVPYNLLPHLKWLTDPAYQHVYYMDGKPLVFDADIFPADSVHPYGWGTVLVMGMRLGGGDINVDLNGNGTPDVTTRSAYVVMDITDPEQPPKLIAEITDGQTGAITNNKLGFTTSYPSVVKERVAGNGNDWAHPAVNKWYLVFGSGPHSLTNVTSNQDARLFVYNLETDKFVSGFDGGKDLGIANSFVGDTRAADWNSDDNDDAVYFGTVGGTVTAPTGTLQRLKVSDLTVHQLLDPGRPISDAPSLVTDANDKHWVFAGTGRIFVPGDLSTTAQQGFYGVKEPTDTSNAMTWGSVAMSDLQNVTGIESFTDGSLLDPLGSLPTSPTIDSYTALNNYIQDNKAGWYLNFTTSSGNPAPRSTTNSAILSTLLLFTDYAPSADSCTSAGSSQLWALNYQTGIPDPYGAFGTTTTVTHNNNAMAVGSVDLGAGEAFGPSIHRGANVPSGHARIFTNTSTGALPSTYLALPPIVGGRQSWREIDQWGG